MLNSKQIGNVTEVECMLAFLKLGYNVLQPYGDCERYDFVADVNGKFYKIQCKTAKESNGTIEFNCRRVQIVSAVSNRGCRSETIFYLSASCIL